MKLMNEVKAEQEGIVHADPPRENAPAGRVRRSSLFELEPVNGRAGARALP